MRKKSLDPLLGLFHINDSQDENINKIYFGNADEFVHARLLEEASIRQKI